MFNKVGFDVYIYHKVVDLKVSRMTKVKKAMENQQLAINELIERMHDVYWKVEDRVNIKQTDAFINELKDYYQAPHVI